MFLPWAAPFPIFNKGKRPKKALLAHPNNMGGGPAQAQQSVQSQWSGYTPSPTPSPRSGDSGSAGSYTASNDHYGRSVGRASYNIQAITFLILSLSLLVREVQLPFPTPPRAPHQYGYGGTGCAAEQQENQQMAMSRASHQRTGFTPYQAGPQQQSGQSWGISASPSCRPHSQSDSGVGRGRTTMVGRAKAGVSFGVSPSPSRTKPRGCIRVLTATAKGMEHWSKYKQHTQMIFEVFGELRCSALPEGGVSSLWLCCCPGMLCTTVTLGNQGAKEFTIKTSDGLVK